MQFILYPFRLVNILPSIKVACSHLLHPSNHKKQPNHRIRQSLIRINIVDQR
ncbi:conserved hypothetical protein [Ricinus communis]|uniref:Uncharacterized protein n=1 Tax=Ricinus communis TaxID=3988 RepID=B9RAD8_RICCO|nr:conserved hypothetical protein [Ricinus communis]